MKLIFLGTGTSMGVPVIACPCNVCHSADWHDRRLRTAALLETDEGANILFDIGPDFREQMLRHKVDHLDAILITHPHRDHLGGIDDVRAFNYIQSAPMQVFGNEVTVNALHRDYGYIFAPHPHDGLPEVSLHLLNGDTMFSAGGVEVMPVKAMHKDMPVLGYRVGKLVYITDANYISSQEKAKIKGCHTLVVNALRQTKHPSHFSLPEALQLIEEVAPVQAFITHISHEMGFYEDISKLLPPNVKLSYDGLEINI